ncbi:hypothetical protein BU24DRAFT_444226 [Aaosphaeria arxii CBS 175.79]|uniref:Uncharacterized protein n=1 Tax=Aaosphaeria arxii CBS 175.79 TaxID=1450172 RepID=A0A6A5XDA7_9PLEO|nr:uncharacterized protein BU24DRAFT_444226 [Aaosphaeria arxii CBS 175.79]KAF2011105.1 hypothetical protein BU24DRAFT_444226 [Aaosphaeria arxii CBS 175.79]
MSFSYDRYDRRQPSRRTTFGYWVPLVFTVTVATAGVAAWVWSARQDEDDSSDDADLSYGEEQRDYKASQGSRDAASHGIAREDDSLMGRVQGVIRRTPSPQQFFDTVSKKTVAGVAAAGAMAGAALASIREEDRDDLNGDHTRWSEEAALRRNVEAQSSQSNAAVDAQTRSFAASVRSGPQYSGKRKTVVLVVSAESLMDLHDDDGSYRSENATILSHLPNVDFSRTKVFVLIYSPSLRSRPNSRVGAASLGSSYSAISTPAQTPGEELKSIDPQPEDTIYTPALSARSSDNVLWNTLHAQALRLVEDPAMVMPFTTPTGHVHMLKHLSPDLVYIVDALSGPRGANVEDIKRWVGQTIVVVGSDGTGLGGLVDTDDEGPVSKSKSEHSHLASNNWWESADMVGLGKGVEVVDASRLTDDFERRVGGRE